MNFKEKRKFPRRDISLPLRYKALRANSGMTRGTLTKNLSEGGVRFTAHEFISLACRLVVEMNLPSIPEPIKAVSKIAWIKKLPTGTTYEVGNRFLDMKKKDAALIASYIQKLASADY